MLTPDDVARCSKRSRNKIVSLKESGRVLRVANPEQKELVTIEVDGCVFKDKDRVIRCDYCIEADLETPCALYVELKGGDISHAYDQLAATIGHFQKLHQKRRRFCRIVASHYPKAAPKVQQLKTKMQRQFKARLEVGTRTEPIDLSKHPYS